MKNKSPLEEAFNESVHQPGRGLLFLLSKREMRVAARMAAGMDADEISKSVKYGHDITREFIAGILRKTQVPNIQAFAERYAVDPDAKPAPEPTPAPAAPEARAEEPKPPSHLDPIEKYLFFNPRTNSGRVYQGVIDMAVTNKPLDNIRAFVQQRKMDPEAVFSFLFEVFSVSDIDELAAQFPNNKRNPPQSAAAPNAEPQVA